MTTVQANDTSIDVSILFVLQLSSERATASTRKPPSTPHPPGRAAVDR